MQHHVRDIHQNGLSAHRRKNSFAYIDLCAFRSRCCRPRGTTDDTARKISLNGRFIPFVLINGSRIGNSILYLGLAHRCSLSHSPSFSLEIVYALSLSALYPSIPFCTSIFFSIHVRLKDDFSFRIREAERLLHCLLGLLSIIIIFYFAMRIKKSETKSNMGTFEHTIDLSLCPYTHLPVTTSSHQLFPWGNEIVRSKKMCRFRIQSTKFSSSSFST